MISNTEAAISALSLLREMNVRISLDDFGTGYSSLSYLKRLPVTGLKIDQSFVRDIASDPDDTAIVRAIIAVAEELNLDVTAEGVETAAQVEYLKSHGCRRSAGLLLRAPDARERDARAARRRRTAGDADRGRGRGMARDLTDERAFFLSTLPARTPAIAGSRLRS